MLARIVAEMLDAAGDPAPDDLDARLRAWVRDHPRRTGTGFHDDARAFLGPARSGAAGGSPRIGGGALSACSVDR